MKWGESRRRVQNLKQFLPIHADQTVEPWIPTWSGILQQKRGVVGRCLVSGLLGLLFTWFVGCLVGWFVDWLVFVCLGDSLIGLVWLVFLVRFDSCVDCFGWLVCWWQFSQWSSMLEVSSTKVKGQPVHRNSTRNTASSLSYLANG